MLELPFDKKQIGRIIALGGEHRVYRYDDNQVIKFPFGPRYWINAKKYCDNLKRDEQIVRQYFGEYLIDREIVYFNRLGTPSYAIIEPKISGRHLKKKDLDDSHINNHFHDLVEINQRLVSQENLSAEFFGLRGLVDKGKKEICNIMLEQGTNKLYLIDAGVMHFGKRKDQQIMIDLVTKWAMKRQTRLLKYYLNESK
jgi:hypothetical protein